MHGCCYVFCCDMYVLLVTYVLLMRVSAYLYMSVVPARCCLRLSWARSQVVYISVYVGLFCFLYISICRLLFFMCCLSVNFCFFSFKNYLWLWLFLRMRCVCLCLYESVVSFALCLLALAVSRTLFVLLRCLVIMLWLCVVLCPILVVVPYSPSLYGPRSRYML